MAPNEQAHFAPERIGNEVLQKALAISALGLPLLAVLLLISTYMRGEMTVRAMSLSGSMLVFPLLWSVRNKLPFGVCALLYLVLLGLTTEVLMLRGGLVTTSGAIPILMIVLSGLFFGRIGSLLCLLLELLAIAVTAVIVLNHLVPPVELANWDPYLIQPWVRSAVAILVFGGGTATAVIYVCEQLESEARKLQLAREREQAAGREKLQAEAERETAREALAESHRLESLGRLAGGVAHDFNNVLTVIMGNVELAMKESGVTGRVLGYLDEIQRASQHSSELTQELLMLSRKDPASSRVLNLGDYLQRMLPTLRRLVPEDIRLTLRVDAPVAHVRVVQMNLERALLNLVANARDAITGAGNIEIAVQMRAAITAGQPEWVQLSVTDDGSGLDAETQKRIFEPFFTTKKAGRGSGLGLMLVQSMVMDAGGSIEVDSAPGKGTRIMLLLPCAEPGIAAVEARAAGKRLLANAGQGRIILVVDDQLAVLSTITAILQHAGFAVITGTSGDEAIKLIDDPHTHFDLLCLDGIMPGASSAQVIATLRQRRPGTPVILCSGYVDEELLLRGIQVGELTCVRKPFHPNELIQAVVQKLSPVRH